jgi:hypothetical protein
MAQAQLIGSGIFAEISEDMQEDMNQIIEKLVHSYFVLCDGDSYHLQCNLTNQYSRDYNYLLRMMPEITELIRCFADLSEVCCILTLEVRKELLQRLKQLFGCVMHGLFPNHFVGFAKYDRNFDSFLKSVRYSIDTICVSN